MSDTLGDDERPDLASTAGGIARVAFRPDGKRLAATGGDRGVRVWNLDALAPDPPRDRP